MWDRAADAGWSLLVGGIMGIASGVIWMVRKVLGTQIQIDAANNQIELLRNEIANRDDLRAADSKRLEELHKDVRELREKF